MCHVLLHLNIQPSSSQKSDVTYKNNLEQEALPLHGFLEQLEGQSPFDVAGVGHCAIL